MKKQNAKSRNVEKSKTRKVVQIAHHSRNIHRKENKKIQSLNLLMLPYNPIFDPFYPLYFKCTCDLYVLKQPNWFIKINTKIQDSTPLLESYLEADLIIDFISCMIGKLGPINWSSFYSELVSVFGLWIQRNHFIRFGYIKSLFRGLNSQIIWHLGKFYLI